MKILTILVLFSICLACGTTACAESVFVKSHNGEVGHAWLFGSPGQSSNLCWLVVPLHVIAGGDGKAYPFQFTDRSGTSGESGEPIPFASIAKLDPLGRGLADLAFAPVDVGRKRGDCMSRLGLPKYSYDSIMRTSPTLILNSMHPTSYGILEAKIDRAGTAEGLIRIRPTSEKADKYVLKGISGSVAEVQRGDETKPFAMVLKADPQEGVLMAMRFDQIREAFNQTEAYYSNTKRTATAKSVGVPYDIVEFKGISVDSTIGPNSLHNAKECWGIVPQGGQKDVSFTIELSDPNDKITVMSMLQANNCGNPPQMFFVDQRVPKVTDWARAATCSTVTENDVSQCRINLKGPRQLKVTFIPQGTIFVSGLILN